MERGTGRGPGTAVCLNVVELVDSLCIYMTNKI